MSKKYTRDEIAEKIQQISYDITGVIPETVNPTPKFVEYPRVYSLDEMEIVVKIEDEFDIEIPDEDVENIKDIGQAIEYIVGKVGA